MYLAARDGATSGGERDASGASLSLCAGSPNGESSAGCATSGAMEVVALASAFSSGAITSAGCDSRTGSGAAWSACVIEISVGACSIAASPMARTINTRCSRRLSVWSCSSAVCCWLSADCCCASSRSASSNPDGPDI
jgi:hypothetical protein